MTALHWAYHNSHDRCVAHLLAKGLLCIQKILLAFTYKYYYNVIYMVNKYDYLVSSSNILSLWLLEFIHALALSQLLHYI